MRLRERRGVPATRRTLDRGDEEARARPAREKAFGDEAVVGLDHGDPRDIVVGGEDAGGGDANSALEPAAQDGVAEIADDLVLQRRRRGSVERETAPKRWRRSPRHGFVLRKLDLSHFQNWSYSEIQFKAQMSRIQIKMSPVRMEEPLDSFVPTERTRVRRFHQRGH